MMSGIIKKTLSEKEEVKKYFSVCNRYIKIRIVAVFLKWLIIFAVISIILFFIDQTQVFAIPETKKIINDQAGLFSESHDKYGIENSVLNFSLIDTNEISNWILNAWIILALIFFLIIVPFIIFYNIFYIRISNEFVFTDQRIIVKRGWIETNVKTIYYNRITDISVSQSLLERIIKSGTMSISTAGSDGYEVVLWHIDKPYELKKLLYDVKMTNQEKYPSQYNEIKQKNEDGE